MKFKIRMREQIEGAPFYVVNHAKFYYGKEYDVDESIAERLVSTGFASHVGGGAKPAAKDRTEEFQATPPKSTGLRGKFSKG